jgi:hypothetical protein
MMSLDKFFDIDVAEKQRRICVALWAWAYEQHSDSIVSDAKFDDTCKRIDTSIETGNILLDNFFKREFSPHTGQWVHKHPEKHKLEALYQRLRKTKNG